MVGSEISKLYTCGKVGNFRNIHAVSGDEGSELLDISKLYGSVVNGYDSHGCL